MISKQEENKISLIAALSSILLMGLIILLLILWIIHVPNPPIPEDIAGGGGGGTGGEIAVNFAPNDPSYQEYKFPEPLNETPATNAASSDNSVLISSPEGVNINEIKPDKSTNANTNNTNTAATHTAATNNSNNNSHHNWANALNNANSNNSGSTTGSNTTGNDIGPGQGPDFGATGTTGTGSGTTGRTGGGGVGFGTGRKTLIMPCRPNVTRREGKVVVTIKVDRNGNVVEADPNGPGTDTSDPDLKIQARKAAECTRFEACVNCPEYSYGTIIFDFGYGK